MNPVRLIFWIAAITGSLAWLYLGGGKAQLSTVDPWFLDFLVANARNAIEKSAPKVSPDVVLVQFGEKDKDEYGSWPPAPLDYIMVLKRISPHEPEVVAFTESLRWSTETPEFLHPLRQALVGMPSTVFGFEVTSEETPEGASLPEAAEFMAKEMPSLSAAENSIEKMPSFRTVTNLPAKTLRVVGQMGISGLASAQGETDAIPMLAREGSKIVPSVVAQAVTLYRRAPFSAMRLRLGPGARLNLGDRFVIPLDATAAVRLPPQITVPTVNALDLLTPELGVPSEEVTRESLGKNKVVVISHSSDGLTEAKAIAAALASPEFRQAPLPWEWIIGGITVILASWQLFRGRLGVLLAGFGLLILGIVTSLLTFQTSLQWCSPLPILAVVAASTLVCFLWPYRQIVPQTANDEPETA